MPTKSAILSPRPRRAENGSETPQTRIKPLSIFLPGRPISVNSMYVRTRYGGTALTRAAREWKATVAQIVGYEALAAGFPLGAAFPADARLAVSYRCVGVRGDADNYAKLLQDGIAEALGINDKRMLIAHAEVVRSTATRATRATRTRDVLQVVGVYLTLEVVQVVPFTAVHSDVFERITCCEHRDPGYIDESPEQRCDCRCHWM